MKTRTAPDWLILLPTLGLLAIGVIMVYSASAVLAHHAYGDNLYYLKRQLFFALLGVLALFVTMNIDYWTWRRFATAGLLVCFLLLLVVLIPGIGLVRGGARSWIGVGAFSVQPSEFTKLAMILFLARYLTERQKRILSFWRGLFPPLLLVGAAFGLILLQPDLGTGTVLVGTCVVMLFAAGARLAHLVGLALVGIAGFAALVLAAPYRIKRITAFLDPWQDPLGSGYHLIQSLYAIGRGASLALASGRAGRNSTTCRNRRRTLSSPFWPKNWAFSVAPRAAALYAAPVAGDAHGDHGARLVRQPGGHRHCGHDRHSGGHQRWRRHRHVPGHGHHVAVSQLWGIVANPRADRRWSAAQHLAVRPVSGGGRRAPAIAG